MTACTSDRCARGSVDEQCGIVAVTGPLRACLQKYARGQKRNPTGGQMESIQGVCHEARLKSVMRAPGCQNYAGFRVGRMPER